MADGFLDKIRDYIHNNRLLEDRADVIVGLSGGADSTALLLVLLHLGYRCTAVHCNFHLRGAESDRDQQFVTDLCKKLGVQLEVCSYDTRSYAKQQGISIEMAARELRYADFERIMNDTGADAVCIAHHRDDSVETVLLNLIRGTGIKGLTGIKPRNGHIIRPLLCVSRQEIEDWLHKEGQPYITDSTNLETDYTRNKIRLQLLPLMRTINPDVDNAVTETAAHLQQSYAVYRNAMDQAEADIITTHLLVKDRDTFTVQPLAISNESITVDIEPGTTVNLPDGRTLKISTAPAGTPIAKSPDIATFDISLFQGGTLTIRPWAAGDRFVPFGMRGSKLVSDFLTDIKVNSADRQNQLVVSFNKDIVWVLGLRTDNRYRVTEQTSVQLVLTLLSA